MVLSEPFDHHPLRRKSEKTPIYSPSAKTKGKGDLPGEKERGKERKEEEEEGEENI